MSDSRDAPLRLLHVVPTYLPATRYGGPIYSVHGLCKALVNLGHEVQVITTSVDGDGDSNVPLGRPVSLDGVQVTYFRSRYLRRLYWSPEMRRGLTAQVPRASVVHLHSVFLWPTSAAARIARASGVPYLVAPRGMLVADLVRRKNRLVKSAWLNLVERQTLRDAARLHVTSDAEYRDACNMGLPMPAPCIVPNGVDFPKAPESLTPSPAIERAIAAGRYVLYVGRLNWKKGIGRLLAALEGTDIRLLVAGNAEEGYLATIERLVREHRLQQRVELLGHVAGDDKWSLMRNARLLALPSFNENFGNVVVEAMGVGCPVVVTPEVGAETIVRSAHGGLVVDGSVEPLRNALLQLWNDDALRKQMGQDAEAFVRAHLTWRRCAEAMVECYRELDQRAVADRARS
jgi:glycosyltransferase involved in cell wall biosynthesis